MEKIENLFTSYGLMIQSPESEDKKLKIRVRKDTLLKMQTKKSLMWMCTFGFEIKPSSIETVFKEFSMPPKYETIKPLLGEMLRMNFYSSYVSETEYVDKAVWYLKIDYENVIGQIKKQIEKNPVKHGINLKKLEFVKMFGNEQKVWNEEAEKRFHLLMEFDEEVIQQENKALNQFMKDFEETSENVKIQEEWLINRCG